MRVSYLKLTSIDKQLGGGTADKQPGGGGGQNMPHDLISTYMLHHIIWANPRNSLLHNYITVLLFVLFHSILRRQ